MSEFDKVIGYESIKFELKRVCDVLKNFEKYEKLGVKQPTGILLHGNAGVGKTLMATVFNKETNWNVYVCRKDKPNGDFVNQIKNTYEQAEKNQPAIVFLDDMDKFSNEDEKHRNSEEFITVQSCIDEYKNKKIFTFATANSIREFPDSLLRAGRFDKVIKINKPYGEDCKKIIEHYLSQKKHISNLDTDEIAKILNHSSCAELELVVNEAGIYAVSQNKSEIDTDDIVRACLRVIFKAPESLSPENQKCIEMIAYHEAGHAVVNEILEPNSVNLVSVCKYEDDIGGITSYNQKEEYFLKKIYMENRVIGLLGGKAATELIYGEVDVGVESDMERAYRITSRFIEDYCSYGFDGFVLNYRDSSDQLLARKENRIIAELEGYYAQAKKILSDNRKFLDEVAKALVEKKTLRAKDIKEIKAKLQII